MIANLRSSDCLTNSPFNNMRNAKRKVWRICILMLRCKGLNPPTLHIFTVRCTTDSRATRNFDDAFPALKLTCNSRVCSSRIIFELLQNTNHITHQKDKEKKVPFLRRRSPRQRLQALSRCDLVHHPHQHIL